MLPISQETEASPFFVIPHSAHLAYVWCQLHGGAVLDEIYVAATAVAVLDRKKLFRPGQSLEVLLIEAPDLRDGVGCELHLILKAGQRQTLDVQARLARWDDPDTSRVLKLIAKRFSVDGEPPHTLERYLAFTSAWQAPGECIETFPEGRLAQIHLDCAEPEIDAYALTTRGLASVAVKVLLARRGSCVIWLDGGLPGNLYFDLGGDLVRVSLQEGKTSSPSLVASWTPAERMALIEALHAGVKRVSDRLHQWVATLCEPQAVLTADDISVDVVGAISLPSKELAIFLGVKGIVADLDGLELETFGEPNESHLEVFSCDTEPAAQDGWQSQFILTTTCAASALTCHRLSWTLNGRRSTVWLRETLGGHARAYMIARDFMTVANVHADVFASVLHPVATMGAVVSPPRLTRRMDFGSYEDDACADVIVFADADLEALHRTIVGLSLTSRIQPFNVHICVFDHGTMAKLIERAPKGADRYALPLRLSCYGSRTTEAEVTRHLIEGDRPSVFVRAGAVPRRSDWLTLVLEKLQKTRNSFLIGKSGTIEPGQSASLPISSLDEILTEGREGEVAPGLLAFAAAPGSVFKMEQTPRLFTMEAFLLHLSVEALASPSCDIFAASELAFAQTGTRDNADLVQAKLDHYSLRATRTSRPGNRAI